MDDLKKLYLDVFEDDLMTVKLCGRDACKRLIVALNEVYPDVDFGSIDSGLLNVPVVQKYGDKIFS